MPLVDKVREVIPANIRLRLREAEILQRTYNWQSSLRLARGSKRLDLCAAQLANLLHYEPRFTLEGATCVEIGSGWVLSHALVLHLLGAQRVIATDLTAVAAPERLRFAVGGAVDSIVRDVLAPFAPHEALRERMARIRGVRAWNWKTLERLGIEYVAPIDFVQQPLGVSIDRVLSLSVLEHVPVEDVDALLNNLAKDLSAGGSMLHAIHLEDHLDFSKDPFAFLAIPAARYGRPEQTGRGNRIRANEWMRSFQSLQPSEVHVLYIHSRMDAPLPTTIDASVRYVDDKDLRASHMGVHVSMREETLTPTANQPNGA